MEEWQFEKFGQDDFPCYFQLVSNEQVMAQITERAIPHGEAMERYGKILGRNAEHPVFGTYKITLGGQFIGLGHLTLDKEQKDTAEIGYMLLPEYWGRGLGSRTAGHLLQLAQQTELARLRAIIDPANAASRKILLNHGFVSEKVCVMDGLPGEILGREL